MNTHSNSFKDRCFTEHSAPPTPIRADYQTRRRALSFLATSAALPFLPSCGGGGDGASSPTSGPATTTAGETFLGDAAGKFSAAASETVLDGLQAFTITTGTTSIPYEYMSVVFAWEDGSYVLDFPYEESPGVLRVVAPAGIPQASGAFEGGPLKVAAVRIRGDDEEISSVMSLTIHQPDLGTIPAQTLMGMLLELTGRYRLSVFERAYAGSADTPSELYYLRQQSTQLFTSKAEALVQGSLPAEEASLRLFLLGLFRALGIHPDQYVTRRTITALNTSGSPHVVGLDFLDDFAVDFDGMVQDLGAKARDISGTLANTAAITGLAAATIFAGTTAGGFLATAAIAATVVGLGIGLVDGIVLDNAGVIGGLGGTDRLRLRGTLRFWADNAIGGFLPDLNTYFLPKSYALPVATFSQRVGAFLWEATNANVTASVHQKIIDSATAGKIFFLQESIAGINFIQSQPWGAWVQENYSLAQFPTQMYAAIFANQVSQPAPLPSGGSGCYNPNSRGPSQC